MSVLLDTDITIEIHRGHDRTILARWASLVESGEQIFISPVVIAEIWAGARLKEHRSIDSFFRFLTILTIDSTIGKLAGQLLNQYSKSHSLELADALIGATAISNKTTLWTRNKKHYPMPNLKFF